MFESHKNQTPDESRNRRILLTTLFIAVIGFPAYLYVTSHPEPFNPTVSETAEQRVDNLCASLPTPESFSHMRKSRPQKVYRRIEVDYYFASDYRTIEEIVPTFIMWLDEKGWTKNSFTNQDNLVRLEFKENNQTITLKNNPYANGYVVTCAEIEKLRQ